MVGRVAWGGEEFERRVAAVDDEDVVKEDGRRDQAHACVYSAVLDPSVKLGGLLRGGT